MSQLNFAIIGAGHIGQKRAAALKDLASIYAICDVDSKKGQELANQYNARYLSSWEDAIKDKKVNALIIATPNNMLSPIAQEAIKNNKHVLIEKPGGRNSKEIQAIVNIAKNKNVVVYFGYNHRFHPGLAKAKEIIDSKEFGPVLFIRAKYGHGGRIGYEKEWRFKKDISGGGELLDQGSHLIDLVNFYLGPMNQVIGFTPTLFWKTDLEDSAFFILKNDKNQYAELSATCVEWKNIFQFEIMLKTAKIQIDALGRSYGTEKLTFYKMKEEMGLPEIEEFEFSGEDDSWQKELKYFIDKIEGKQYDNQSIQDALYVMKTIEKLYSQK